MVRHAMGTSQTIAKNTVFNFIATASDLLINLLIGIMLARGFGPTQYGLYSLLLWFLGFATIVVNLGLGEMLTRYIAEAIGQQRKDVAAGLTRLGIILRGSAAFVVAVLVLAFSGFWVTLFGGHTSELYFSIIAITLIPHVLNFILIRIFAGFQKYEYGAFVILGTNPLRAALVLVLMILGSGILEVLVMNLAVWLLGVFIGIFLLRRLIPLKNLLAPSPISSAARSRALKYSLVMTGVVGINYLVYEQANVFFIGLYCDVQDVGFYSLASKLSRMTMLLVPSVFGAVLLPTIAEQFGRGDMDKLKQIYRTSARYIAILALPLAASGIALAKPIITLLYGTDYLPAVFLMQILFIPFAMASINRAASAVIFGINEAAYILRVGAFLGCLNIGLSLWLIPLYGTIGAAIASSIPLVLSLPFYARFTSKRIGAAWPLLDMAKIALAALIAGLALFGLQSQLSAIPCLIISVPVGIVIYVGILLFLRVVKEQDLAILGGIQNLLPVALRKNYAAIVCLVDRLVKTRHAVWR